MGNDLLGGNRICNTRIFTIKATIYVKLTNQLNDILADKRIIISVPKIEAAWVLYSKQKMISSWGRCLFPQTVCTKPCF